MRQRDFNVGITKLVAKGSLYFSHGFFAFRLNYRANLLQLFRVNQCRGFHLAQWQRTGINAP